MISLLFSSYMHRQHSQFFSAATRVRSFHSRVSTDPIRESFESPELKRNSWCHRIHHKKLQDLEIAIYWGSYQHSALIKWYQLFKCSTNPLKECFFNQWIDKAPRKLKAISICWQGTGNVITIWEKKISLYPSKWSKLSPFVWRPSYQ